MRILYHHRIASRDGQYIHLMAILTQLKKQGHEVYLLGPDLGENSGMGGQKEWIHFLKRRIPKLVYELIEFSYCFYDFIQMCLAIRKFKPDCIYERENIFFVSGIWASKLFNLPLILEVNAPLFKERNKYDGIFFKSLADWSEAYVWRNADYVLPVTKVLAEYVIERVAPKHLEVIHNGIAEEDLLIQVDAQKMREKLGVKGKTILGFVGFVRSWHRLDRVIDYIASKKDENLCLLVVGEGPDCENLVNYADKMKVTDKLIMVGVVQRDLMASYINIFDVAIQSAVTDYASPLKLFEYLYLERVVIAPDLENIREIITHGENGLLFKENDRESLFAALDQALGAEKDQLAIKARQSIFDKQYLWRENARKIADLFQRLISQRR